MTTTRPRAAGASASNPTSVDELVETLAPLLAQQRRRWAERCQAHGLSIIGFHAVALLEERGPTSMSRLADDLGVALPNATGIVDRLCERGLVERTPDPADRRIVRVGLTDAGRALVAEMEAGRRERLRRLFGALTPTQQRRLAVALRDLARAAATLAPQPSTES